MSVAQASWLPDGQRLHMHHGPIDMIVGIEGAGRDAAFNRAVARFGTLMDELVAELPRLRRPGGGAVEGETARRMVEAVRPFAPEFVTPMAAVAGAGAETIPPPFWTGRTCPRHLSTTAGTWRFTSRRVRK